MRPRTDRAAFAALAPAGYYVALRVGFVFPAAEISDLPRGWVDRYSAEGLMLHDPVVHWLFGNSGAVRWRDIDLPDRREVLAGAAAHGMAYGVAVSLPGDADDHRRSLGYFARGDREFDAPEIRLLTAHMQRLHAERSPPVTLTAAECQALGMVRDGFLAKEIASRLGVTEGAIKQRLHSARLKLNARTGTQATAIAMSHGLI